MFLYNNVTLLYCTRPQFFPNPQDGSLYRYNLGRGRDPLKKLPFTIPQLVANSPCRSSDGIFYLGTILCTHYVILFYYLESIVTFVACQNIE